MTREQSHIIKVVCERMNMLTADVFELTKKAEIVLTRQLCMYFLFHFTRTTKRSIAEIFGKHHATVIHAIEAINNYCLSCEEVQALVIELETEFEKQLLAA